MRGSSSVFVQVTIAPALIVKNMAIPKCRLRDRQVYSLEGAVLADRRPQRLSVKRGLESVEGGFALPMQAAAK